MPAAGIGCDGFNGATNSFVTGNVDRRTFTDANGTIYVDQSSAWSASDCRLTACFTRPYWPENQGGFGLLGCQLLPNRAPGGVIFYAGRTCLEEGFDGWINIPVNFRANLIEFTYTAADVTPSFTLRQFDPLNTTVPEPRTYALMAAGLLGLVGMRRWQRVRSA